MELAIISKGYSKGIVTIEVEWLNETGETTDYKVIQIERIDFLELAVKLGDSIKDYDQDTVTCAYDAFGEPVLSELLWEIDAIPDSEIEQIVQELLKSEAKHFSDETIEELISAIREGSETAEMTLAKYIKNLQAA